MLMKEVSENYRISHSHPNYGLRYKKTYEQGYYFEQWRNLERPLLEKIFKELAENGSKYYLDFACGTGRIISVAEKYFDKTYGVDVSDSMLSIAKQACKKSNLIKQDITIDPIDKKFEVITAFRFFLNAEPQLRSSALKTIQQLLTPNGIFIANCHVNSKSILGMFYHIRNRINLSRKANTLSYGEFKALLGNHGFEIHQAFWYSYLPRIGNHLEWIPKKFMVPCEKLCKAIPIFPSSMAQSFMVVCKKT